MIAAASDVSLTVSANGRVEQISWNVDDAEAPDPARVIGASLEDLVAEDSRVKVREMLADAHASKSPRWREINLIFESIGSLPVRMQSISCGDDRVIFMGRELRAVSLLQQRLLEAQRSLDEDYGRLRQLQTRYRVLFQTSAEPLVIADGKTRRIQEANSAAGKLLGQDPAELVGQAVEALFFDESRSIVRDMVERVTGSGLSEAVSARARGLDTALECRATVFRAAESTMLLCRLGARAGDGSEEPQIERLLFGMVNRIPDAMVLTDDGGQIMWCNEAFLSIAEVAVANQARGTLLAQFLNRPGVDMDVIIDNVLENGRLRAFSSVLSGAFGSETRVEISVVLLPDAIPRAIGFVMRDITRHDQLPSRQSGSSSEAQDQMMDLVGQVPLKELVRASTEEIEKICIEAALQKTGNNRASAAEMLGLSRQSLYVKLRRFGLLES